MAIKSRLYPNNYYFIFSMIGRPLLQKSCKVASLQVFETDILNKTPDRSAEEEQNMESKIIELRNISTCSV